MRFYEISEKLEQLKESQKVTIITFDNQKFDVYYENIINDEKQELLHIPAENKLFLYCSISDIKPRY